MRDKKQETETRRNSGAAPGAARSRLPLIVVLTLAVASLVLGAGPMGKWGRAQASMSEDPASAGREKDLLLMNVSVQLSKDEVIGNGDPPGDVVHRGIPAVRSALVVVEGPPDTRLELSLLGPKSCVPRWTNPIDPFPSTINNLQTSVVRLNNLGAGTFTMQYTVNCSAAGNYTLQMIANVDSLTVPFTVDPDVEDNQDQNQISVIVHADYDGDGIPTPGDNCPDVFNAGQEDMDGNGTGDVCDPDIDGDGIANDQDQCPGAPEDPDGRDDGDGCPDTDASISMSTGQYFQTNVSESTVRTATITIGNGNYPDSNPLAVPGVDLRVTLLAASRLNGCEVRLMPSSEDSYIEFTTDESGDGNLDTLYSQIERIETAFAAFESRVLTRQYQVHCFQRSQHSFELQADVVPMLPVKEELAFLGNSVYKSFPTVVAWEWASVYKVGLNILGPESVEVNVPFEVTVISVIGNNGPAPANVLDTIRLFLPSGCTTTSPDPRLTTVPDLQGGTTAVVEADYSVVCTIPGEHSISATHTLFVTGPLHVRGPAPTNSTVSRVLTAGGCVDQDMDGIPDGCDLNGDGIIGPPGQPNSNGMIERDNCPTVPNAEQQDWNSDGIGDSCQDSDGDGFTDAVELYIGTDPASPCGIDAWPPDINNDGFIDTQDILQMAAPAFFRLVGDPRYRPRLDLNADGITDSMDVLAMGPLFFTGCTAN